MCVSIIISVVCQTYLFRFVCYTGPRKLSGFDIMSSEHN